MPTVLCYGDSNTHGTMPMTALGQNGRFGRDTRWPCVMAAELGADWHLVEEGLPGRTTVHEDPVEGGERSGLKLLDPILRSHLPVDLVILMLGTNDLKARFAVTPFDIARSNARLVEAIRAACAGPGGGDPRILLVCPPPVEECGPFGDAFLGAAAKARGLRDQMRAVAGLCGIDFFDAGTVARVDMADGVHFAAETHVALGRAMAAEVRRVMG